MGDSILTVRKETVSDKRPMVRELEPGTFLDEVTGGNDCVYVKVNKRKSKSVGFNYTPGYCLLFNLTYGSIREVKSDTRCRPLDPTLVVSPLSSDRHYEVKR